MDHNPTQSSKDPPPHVTPEQRRKLIVLSVIAITTLVALWLLSLPFTLRTDGSGAAGPQELFQVIGSSLSETGQVRDDAKKGRDAAATGSRAVDIDN